MTYKIEKGIPMEKGITGRRRNPLTDVLESMSITNSVLVTDQNRPCVSSVVNRATVRTGREFKTRTMDGGIRIWRVS